MILADHIKANTILRSWRNRLKDIVDARDWNGLDLKGNNDNSSILQAWIDEVCLKSRPDLGFSGSKRGVLPIGRLVFDTQLQVGQGSWLEGTSNVAGGTELWWGGADGVDAIVNKDVAELSYVRISNLRVEDKRSSPTGGRGIALQDVNNSITLERLQVMQFPLEQIYVGAESGEASDCVELADVWVVSQKEGAKGILLERIDNYAILRRIHGDLGTTPANDGYVIRIQTVPNDSTVVSIDTVKHEGWNRCPTISLPVNTRGNLSIRNVIQRNPPAPSGTEWAAGAAGAGDVIQIGASAAGSDFAHAWGGEITTGATSEIGARLTTENITGANHSDWTGATGAAMVRLLGTTRHVYGAILRAQLGSAGGVLRDIVGDGVPNGVVYGNVGDRYRRRDATSGLSPEWIKRVGAGTNTGWAPLNPEAQSLAYSATRSVNLQLGNRVQIGALTGNITISNPTNVPPPEVEVVIELTQDGTGGRTIAWGSAYKGAWPTNSGTANQKRVIRGYSDATNIVFASDSGWF